MRLVGSWIFILLYGVALLKPIQPLIEYVVRYDLYSKVLCVNRDRPELKCNGKCILMQRLKVAAREETPFVPATQHVNMQDYPIGFIHFVDVNAQASYASLQHGKDVAFNLPAEVTLPIFHPPS